MSWLVLSEGGVQLSCEGERLRVARGGRLIQEVRFQDLERVTVFGKTGLSADAVRRLLRRGIEVTFLDRRGRLLGRLGPPGSRNARLRIAQARLAGDEAFSLSLARRFVAGKLRNQRRVLLRYRRRHGAEAIRDAAGRLRLLASRADTCDAMEELLGLEGAGAQTYFKTFGRLVRNPLFSFPGRNRRPPKDPINACLSFGYAVAGSVIEGEAAGVGFEPTIGFLHKPEHGRPSLALDILEEFRPLLVDSVVLTLVNRRQLTPADFGPPPVPGGAEPSGDPWLEESGEPASEGVYLGRTGRPILLRALIARMRGVTVYSQAGQALEVREIIRRQCWALARAVKEADPALYQPFEPEE